MTKQAAHGGEGSSVGMNDGVAGENAHKNNDIPRGEGTEAVTAENVRLRAALDAAIKADDALTRAEWAEGELDRIGAWVAKLIGEQPRDQIAPTCIVNLDRLVKMTAAHPAGGEGLRSDGTTSADRQAEVDEVLATANRMAARMGAVVEPDPERIQQFVHGPAGGEAPSVVGADLREAMSRLAEMAGWLSDGEASEHMLAQSVAEEHAADIRAILAALATLQPDGGHGSLREQEARFVPTEQAETPVVGDRPDFPMPLDGGSGGAKVVLHPNTVLAACDAEADVWWSECDVRTFVEAVRADPAPARMEAFARQCFVEGAYRGAMNVIEGKPLALPPAPTDTAGEA